MTASMTAPIPAPAAVPPRNSAARVIVSSLVGTSVEFYDFYIYATASVLVFPALFFPAQNTATALLASFAVFGVAFVARPLGSVIFGHLGDRLGRKNTLVLSLLVMGSGTFLVGCLPAATTPGWIVLAPALLVLLRFMQGIALAGEWSGAVLVATENAPRKHLALYGSIPQQGAPIGFILANGGFLLIAEFLDPEAFLTWAWRVPFWCSAVLVALGLWTRLKLVESASFEQARKHGAIAKAPALEVLRKSWRLVLIGTIASVSNFVTFYFITTFTLTFGTAPATVEQAASTAAATGKPFDPAGFVAGLGYGRSEFLMLMLASVIFLIPGIAIGASLAQRWGRRRAMLVFHVLVGCFGLAVPALFHGSTALIYGSLVIGFFVFGLTYGPLGAFLAEIFPSNTRYTGTAFSFNFASVLGAAVAPYIFVAFWQLTGDLLLVGLYVALAAVLSVIAISFARPGDGDLADFVSAD